MFDLKTADLRKLNSLTKYPSIPTYHRMGERGRLTDELSVSFEPSDVVVVTEKLDGVNARIVVLPGGQYLIGSREELLHARGDILFDPSLGIVEALRSVADRITTRPPRDEVYVYYFEVFGGKVTAASRQYTGNQVVCAALFDLGKCPIDVMNRDLEDIARWRDMGGQAFMMTRDIDWFTSELQVAMVPALGSTLGTDVPTSHADVLAWVGQRLPQTRFALDPGAMGKPEGVVIRTPNRSKIAKIRFEDYERTLRDPMSAKALRAEL